MIPLTKESRQAYDIEWTSKPKILLKGIGRYCEVCGKHIFGDPRKKTCSEKCRHKREYNRYHKGKEAQTGFHAFIILKKSGLKNQYRTIKVYLKKSVIEEVKITPESKELWALLEKIESFRNLSKPLVEIPA